MSELTPIDQIRLNQPPGLRPFDHKPAPADGYSGTGNLLRSAELDTWLGQLVSHGFGGFSQPDPNYNIMEDPQMVGNEDLLLNAMTEVRSAEEAADYIARYRHNQRLRNQLDGGGATWSRFFSQFADPLNFTPLATARGIGLVRGALRGAYQNTGISAASEGLRAQLDPTMTMEEGITNIAFGTLIGAGLGGISGKFLGGTGQGGATPRTDRENRRKIFDFGKIGQRISESMRNQNQVPFPVVRDSWFPIREQVVSHFDAHPTGVGHNPKLFHDIQARVEDMKANVAAARAYLDREINGGTGSGAEVVLRVRDEKGIRLLKGREANAEARAIIKTRSEIAQMERSLQEEGMVDLSGLSNETLSQIAGTKRKMEDEGPPPAGSKEPIKQRAKAETIDDPVRREEINAEGVQLKTDETLGRPLWQIQAERLKATEERLAELQATRAARVIKLDEAKAILDNEYNVSAREFANDDYLDARALLNEVDLQIKEAKLDLDHEQMAMERVEAEGFDYYGGSELAPMGGRSFRWSQFPFFNLMNTKIKKHSPRLAHNIRIATQRLAAPFNLRTVGEMEGTQAREMAVESAVYLWRGLVKGAQQKHAQAYMELLEKTPGLENAERALMMERAKQWASGVKDTAAKVPGLGKVVEPSTRLNGLPTFAEFDEIAFMQLGEQNGAWSREYSEAVMEAAEKSAQAWDDVFREFDKAFNELGLYHDAQSINRKIEGAQTKRAELEEKSEQMRIERKRYLNMSPEELESTARVDMDEWLRNFDPDSLPQWRKNYIDEFLHKWIERRPKTLEFEINRAEVKISELADEIEDLKYDLDHLPETATVRRNSNGRYAPVQMDLESIDELSEQLIDDLEVHFRNYPKKMITARDAEEIPSGPEHARRRAEETALNMRREALTPDEIEAKMQGNRLRLQQQLNEARLELGAYDQLGLVERGHIIRDEVWGTIEGDEMAHIKYHNDGTATIMLDRAKIEAAWNTGLPEKLHHLKTLDEWTKHVINHERAHARLLRRKRTETDMEYEMRVDKEAQDSLLGKKLSDAERQALTRRVERMENKLKRFDEGRHSVAALGMTRTPNMADVPLSLLRPYINTSMESVMEAYLRRAAPAIELTKAFGDPRMEQFLVDLADDMNRLIDGTLDEAEAQALTKERDDVLQSFRDLRDMVLGTHGYIRDPTAFDEAAMRFTTLMKNQSVLSLMGRPVLSAFADTGTLIVNEGASNIMRGILRAGSTSRDASSAYRMGRAEAEIVGLVGEVTSNMRTQMLYGITEYHGKTTGFEKFFAKNAPRQFILNLLSFWTDTLKGFVSHIIIDRMIAHSIKLTDGSLGKAETEALTHIGIDPPLARRIREQWEAVGKNGSGPKHEGLHIADTSRWPDQRVAQQFRQALVMAVNESIITPQAGNTGLYMSKAIPSMILQYRGFSQAFTSAVVMSSLQRTVGARRLDLNVLNGAVAMIAIAYVVDRAKTPGWAKLSWDEQIFRAVEKSGVLGVFSDLNSIIETATGGSIGARSMLGQDLIIREPTIMDQVTPFVGPGPTLYGNLIHAMFAPEATGDQQARALRYMIPYNNLIYWNGLFSDAQRGLGDWLED